MQAKLLKCLEIANFYLETGDRQVSVLPRTDHMLLIAGSSMAPGAEEVFYLQKGASCDLTGPQKVHPKMQRITVVAQEHN